jgi:shikimate dehydrogenase
MTAKAGVVGWPIEHSLSPILHGYWLKQYGIDGSYERIPAEPGKFKEVISSLRDKDFRGVNVTVPYKEEALSLAQISGSAARVAGAANLLVFSPDGVIGANNTDASGLFDSLEEKLGRVSLAGKNIVLLGAGGAARGAAFGLHALGYVAKVTVLNRNKDRADQLVAHINAHLPSAKFETGTLEDWRTAAEDAWLVVNTTSAGMKGNPPLDIDLSILPDETAVCDIVYNPLRTPLLAQAEARGLRTVDGLGMLMHQAVPSFQAFFFDEMSGKMPEVTPGLRAELERVLRERQ